VSPETTIIPEIIRKEDKEGFYLLTYKTKSSVESEPTVPTEFADSTFRV
jgi:hypothetical protein